MGNISSREESEREDGKEGGREKPGRGLCPRRRQDRGERADSVAPCGEVGGRRVRPLERERKEGREEDGIGLGDARSGEVYIYVYVCTCVYSPNRLYEN